MDDSKREAIRTVAAELTEALNADDAATRNSMVSAARDVVATLVEALPTASRDDIAGLARSWALAARHISNLPVSEVGASLAGTYVGYSLAAAELAGVYPVAPAEEGAQGTGMYL